MGKNDGGKPAKKTNAIANPKNAKTAAEPKLSGGFIKKQCYRLT